MDTRVSIVKLETLAFRISVKMVPLALLLEQRPTRARVPLATMVHCVRIRRARAIVIHA